MIEKSSIDEPPPIASASTGGAEKSRTGGVQISGATSDSAPSLLSPLYLSSSALIPFTTLSKVGIVELAMNSPEASRCKGGEALDELELEFEEPDDEFEVEDCDDLDVRESLLELLDNMLRCEEVFENSFSTFFAEP